MTTSTPLTDLTSPQIDKALAKLQIVSPAEKDVEEKVELLRYSKVFNRYFSLHEDEDVVAIFDSKGKFKDFASTDNKIRGIFADSPTGGKLYPCNICAKEVTDLENSTGRGLECSGCFSFFHNSCTNKQVSIELYKALKTSPSHVKVFCPSCDAVYGSTSKKIRRLDTKIDNIGVSLDDVNKKLDDITTNSTSYSDAAKKNFTSKNVFPQQVVNKALSTKLAKELSIQNKATKEAEREKRNKTSRIILKPLDKNIRNSRDIRSSLNKEFPGVAIRECRTTVGGSIFVQFASEDEAVKVERTWKRELFGGNAGISSPNAQFTSGVIRHVFTDASEKELVDHITAIDNIEKCELFKPDGKFKGTVKLVFKDRGSLETAMDDCFTIFNQRYITEEYKSQPRVIKCHRCQRFGHISRLCRSEIVKCGKCSEEGHETRDCTTGVIKCAHCGMGHITGSKDCRKIQEKLNIIRERANYD